MTEETVSRPLDPLRSSDGGNGRASSPPVGPQAGVRRTMALAGAAVIAAVLLAGCGGGEPEEEASPTPEPSPTAVPSPTPSVAAPAALKAKAGGFSVTLTWSQPSAGTPVESYEIYRDGDLVATVEASATAYEDDEVLPGRRYSYAVEALGGGASSQSVSVSAETKTPPLKAARVEGVFNVRFERISSSGYSRLAGKFSRGWEFKPRCATGPCAVRWNDVGEKSLRAVLPLRGAKYRGSDSGKFNTRCGETMTVSSLTIEFRVTKAKAMSGDWRATRLEGTVTQSEAAQLGCVSSGATSLIKAKLVA